MALRREQIVRAGTANNGYHNVRTVMPSFQTASEARRMVATGEWRSRSRSEAKRRASFQRSGPELEDDQAVICVVRCVHSDPSVFLENCSERARGDDNSQLAFLPEQDPSQVSEEEFTEKAPSPASIQELVSNSERHL